MELNRFTRTLLDPKMSWTRYLALLSVMLLSSCRMPVVLEGEGYVFGEISGEFYRHGYRFNINEDFNESFWPVPAPGYSFAGWNAICKGTKKVPCKLELNEQLWEQNKEIPLSARYEPGYEGPLELLDYSMFWYEESRTIRIPSVSFKLAGAGTDASPQLYLAKLDLSILVPGTKSGGYYVFSLKDIDVAPTEFELFVSARDANGVFASVAFRFGVQEYASTDSLHPHNPSTEWADALAGCALADDLFRLCALDTLPYLGTITQSPTVNDVMDRTAVSHDWMGARFKQVLNRLPREMLKMFRSVTAVVISSDIRPSFYSPISGAVYLDPQDLWLTPRERNMISWEEDYRSEFGSSLQFDAFSFYVSGGEDAWKSSSDYSDGATRNIEDVVLPMAYLLAHELAHAGDAVPPTLMPASYSTALPIEVYFNNQSRSATTDLENTYPLNSELLHRIGGVLYQGDSPSSQIEALTATEVGLEFAQDSANTMYAYSTPFEDTASLIEEVLLSHYFGLDKVQSFVEMPPGEDPQCNDFRLRWGSLNRVSKPEIKERARLVLAAVLGTSTVSSYINSVPASSKLTRNIGLCASLDLLRSPGDQTPGIHRNVPSYILREQARIQAHSQVQVRATGIKARDLR